jgi:hypothetical protein
LLVVAVPFLVAGCGEAARHTRVAAIDPQLAIGWKTDFTKATVPLDEFTAGGPGKDGIPALTHPRFAPAAATRYLRPREPVIELVVGRDARAYPLQILIWHEIVDDTVGGVPVAVTFCPLCDTAIAFDRRIDGRTLTFGTTGNLRNSDLVMYDRQTDSWWQQFGGEGVVGRYAGTKLRRLPAGIVSWADFRRAHPDGLVLTRNTGYARNYGQNPYPGYDYVSSRPFFPVANAKDRRLPPKERVVFVERGGASVAIPFSTLARRRRLRVRVGGHTFDVRFEPGVASALDAGAVATGRTVGSARVLEDGRPVAFSEPFWFAVAAFRPNVKIIR